MVNVFVVLIAIVAGFLIGAILIQNPKGGGLDASMGGSANQMFGATRSADFVEKATWYLGGALIVLCIVITILIPNAGQ
jgi:preprotein translocase subunit SecG